jgi:hypothetical protein
MYTRLRVKNPVMLDFNQPEFSPHIFEKSSNIYNFMQNP